MNPYNYALLFFSFCTFIISFLILLRRQDAVAKRYFIFSLFVSFWGSALSIVLSQNASYETALACVRFSSAMAVFIPITWLHFVLTFTGKDQNYKTLLSFLYGLGVLIDCFSPTKLFVPTVYGIAGFVHYGQLGPIYHIFTFMFFLVVPLGFMHLYKKMKDPDNFEQFQIKGLLIAALFGFLGGGLTFLPSYGINFPQYGIFLMPAYPFMMAYFIMRERLFNIEELAQAAHREKLAAIGTLASSINHEIRNPLYIIQGLAQSFIANYEEGIFQDKNNALEKAVEVLRKASSHSIRAVDIMKRFAMFSKRDAKQKPRIEPVNLNQILSDVLPLVNHELELDKIDLVQNIPQNLPAIKIDRRHLEEILFNLIVNACQAMKETEIAGIIEINAVQQNGHVNILVKDNGPGIPADKIKQVFEPFYTTKEQGTGLGLYIIKQLVKENNGKISVKSKSTGGTEFLLCFHKATEEKVEGNKMKLIADTLLKPITQHSY